MKTCTKYRTVPSLKRSREAEQVEIGCGSPMRETPGGALICPVCDHLFPLQHHYPEAS